LLGTVVASLCLAKSTGGAVAVEGAGATLPAPLYLQWAEAYRAKTGVSIGYKSSDSGAGIKAIEARSVDFGGTDEPLSMGELGTNGLVQFPAVLAGITPVVNLKGVKGGVLRLTAPVLADIFLGKIKVWNHPALVALNKDLTLPAEVIRVLYRGDESGTTFLFTLYLSRSSADWQQKIGAGKSVKWPTGSSYAGSEALAAAVSATPASISYVDYGRAVKRKLGLVQLQNRSKRFVLPGDAAFQAAGANAP
jgi:phosphate transport system substrate-binding protein